MEGAAGGIVVVEPRDVGWREPWGLTRSPIDAKG